MSIYNLPNCNTNVYTYIHSSHSNRNLIPVVISHTLYQYVRKLKIYCIIQNKNNIDQYEYIYSILPVKRPIPPPIITWLKSIKPLIY